RWPAALRASRPPGRVAHGARRALDPEELAVAARLDEPVRVEQDPVAPLELELLVDAAQVLLDAERRRGRGPELLARADPQRRGMPGERPAQGARDRRVRGADRRREPVGEQLASLQRRV